MSEVSILELELQNEKPTVSNPVEAVVSSELRDFKGRIPLLLELERKAKIMVESDYFKPAIMGFEAALRDLE
tara:strand:+ start:9284 stop:9499 length:216 start_codon:yes stop_codon:yes gene_type:complete